MNRLRAPPVATNRKMQQKISIKIEIDTRKGMTMNQKNKKGKRLTSTLMAVLMSVSTTLTSVNSIASEMETSSMAVESITEETTTEANVQTAVETTVGSEAKASTSASEPQAIAKETTAEVVQSEAESFVAEKVQSSGEYAEEPSANETRGPNEAKETSENETEIETEPETEIASETETERNPFESLDPASGFSESDLAGIDFSSKRLLVAADTTVILDPEHVLSSYAGVYLLQYETETQAKYAYAYYYSRSEFVDVDTVISVADGDGSANAAAPMAMGENPIAELQEAVAENPVKAVGAVAVIDTGVNGVSNVTESVSMIGDNTVDENGHGTKMAQLVVEQNPNVSILSIKALGADGTGDVSAVYAAIQYAIDKQVSVINLSMSALGTAENAALTSIVNDAVAAGIVVVGAAGNNGHDVRFYVPGNIESAYIVGAADEDGARIASSNYGTTVDFNVVADSTSEAAAKFSGYYTVNGALADEKLVFPTDYVKEEAVDFNGPIVNHQISYYDYKKSMDNLVWIAQREMKTTLDEEDNYFTTYLGFVEDSAKVQNLDVYVDFMDTVNEHAITSECSIDLENMLVKIPMSYQDADVTVRWYMTNASYGYAYDVDAKYMMSDTPEPFRTADPVNDQITGLDFTRAWNFVQGTWSTGFTHTPDSMNHCEVTYSLDNIKPGNYFAINSGYTGIVDGWNNKKSDIQTYFGGNALKYYKRNTNTKQLYEAQVEEQVFLNHFSSVTRIAGKDDATNNVVIGEDVTALFNTITSKEIQPGIIHVDTNKDGHVDTDVSTSVGWVFGTCAKNNLGGSVPTFLKGEIICTNKDVDGTAYFFYYCESNKSQWSGGSFSLTPVLPKNGYLRIHKSSSDQIITNGNSCYKFEGIQYGIFTDEACINNLVVLSLDANGYTQPYELPEGTYYVREADATWGSGYKTNDTVYTVNVTAGTTSDAPVTCETVDQPLNDPFGIQINKVNADETTIADLSGAEYTITYYPKQYNSVAEIHADTDPEVKPTVWVIQTTKRSDGSYYASLKDECIVPNSNSAGAVFGNYYNGNYMIPLGTITVEETKAPKGFTVDGATVSNAKTGAKLTGTNNVYLFQLVDENSSVCIKSGNALSTSVDDETAVTITYAEVQNKAGISIQKSDALTNAEASAGTLEGIKFAIVNATGSDIVNYAGQTISNGCVVQMITTDANGYATTGKTDLPVGNYTIKELRADASFDGKKFAEGSLAMANEYYQWMDNQVTVTITDGNAGTVVNAGTVYDNPVRGDLSFVKKNSETEETLAYVPFKITNNNTGEVHYILTDANGTFNSATGRTINTNANDAVLAQYAEKDIIPQSVIDSLTKDAGLWFGTADANDSYGAFAYGNYTIVELKTEATKNMKMYTNTFTINTVGQVLDFGTVKNVPMSIHTTLADENGVHFTEATSTVTLIDHVAYKNLDTDKTYTLTGTLYVKDGDTLKELLKETVEFEPTETNGIQDVTFTFDAVTLVGKSVVAFEELSFNGEYCAEHKDKNDENQTVYFPAIKTKAVDKNTGLNQVKEDRNVTVVDTVIYTGLQPGKTYTMTGMLMSSAGNAILFNGKRITASTEFVPTQSDGSVDVVFNFDATNGFGGCQYVFFEYLYLDGVRIAAHTDISDTNQIIYIPNIKTTLIDAENGSHSCAADQDITLIDTVRYNGVEIGRIYTVTGILVDKVTGKKIVDDAGNEITASVEFTAEKTNGTIDVAFVFSGVSLAGKTVVAYEYMYTEDKEVAVHADINDENQTVYIPQIHTTAVGKDTQDHIEKAKEDTVIIDTVSYEGLEIGREYTMQGTLVDKETGEPILVDGEVVIAEETFAAETQEGSVDITFTFNASALAGKSLVAFEKLYTEEKEVAVHADITDEGQTVRIPEIHTTATDKITGDHDGVVAAKTTVLDEVFYTNLMPGKEYTLKGALMVKETGEPLTVDGKEITAEKTFVAEEPDGRIVLEFTFNSLAVAGKHVVAFEDVEYEGVSIGTHADIEDEDQTISYPSIHTTAADQAFNSKTMVLGTNVTLADTVAYTGLTVGKSYTVKGTVMDKASGQPIGVTAKTTFLAETTDGSIEVPFTFDTTVLQGKTLVVFESLYDTQGNLIVDHSDINDEDQTVSVPVQPEIPPVVTGDDSTPMPYVVGLAVAVLAAMAVAVALLRERKSQK